MASPDDPPADDRQHARRDLAEQKRIAGLLRARDDRRTLATTDWVAHTDKAHLEALAESRVLAATHFYNGLVDLRDDFQGSILLPPPREWLPRALHGTARGPSGAPAAGLVVTVLPLTGLTGETIEIRQAAVTDAAGAFTFDELPKVVVSSSTVLTLQFRGANGKERRDVALDPNGVLGEIALQLGLQPVQQSVIASLAELVGGLEAAQPAPPRPGTGAQPVTLALGDGACRLDFSHDLPVERHRWSMLVRLVEPRTSVLTQTLRFRSQEAEHGIRVALRNKSWQDVPGAQASFSERVPIDQPISVDGFRDRLVGLEHGAIVPEETIPMAGTLGLGYVLNLGQRWTPQGLSLGDLVYSLPLAPGEQQRIAVFEQRQTLSTAETETLDYAEQQRANQVSDASTQAVFSSAFAEHVVGTSSFNTSAESSSWGVAGGIGAIFPPVAIGIGAGGGGGSSSSGGSSRNSLDGTRDYVSTATSNAHNSIERQASARRHAQRTGMRMATASDRETTTTRVIANNNRIHALTMQYWEVLRHFEVTTEVDGVTLVCFVPLEVVRFMPPGVHYTVDESELSDRAAVLYRYGALLKHADVLSRWIPLNQRQGLKVLEEFASNPRAQPSFTSATEDIVTITLNGSFLPCEDVYVTVVTRRGTRLGPVRMGGSVAPLPDTTTDPTHAFSSRTQLVGELLKRRAPGNDVKLTATIALPTSINPDDVVGFELSRRFRTLKYQLAPPANDPFAALLQTGSTGDLHALFPWVSVQLDAQLSGVTMAPTELEAELGGPSIWGFSAGIVGPPNETYAADVIGAPERFPLPADGYPIAARAVSPLLKFNELLRIEAVLQHVTRNTVTYSRAVWMSLTPEERAIMLEGFTIGVPADGLADDTQTIPLLNCVANQVLAYYGNAMVMPFNIPAEVTANLGVDGDGERRPFTSAEVQNALTQFHREGFAPPVSHVALPTHGVLGEAVLGVCPSAEKIDLTRFWNWGDSPIAQAEEVAGSLLNKGSSLAAATAPSSLAGMPSSITNINAPPADANAALQALIAGQNTKDLPDITGMQELATLQGKTLDTAEKARADALARAQTLASEGLNKAGEMMKAKLEAGKSERADQQRQQTEAQQHQTQRSQQAVTTMRSGAGSFLGVADAKADQPGADAYAQQLVTQVFGGAPPIDAASLLFEAYHKLKSGSTTDLTQGSTAFLRALGLGS